MKRKYIYLLSAMMAICIAFVSLGVYVSGEHPDPTESTASATQSETTVQTTAPVSTSGAQTTATSQTVTPTSVSTSPTTQKSTSAQQKTSSKKVVNTTTERQHEKQTTRKKAPKKKAQTTKERAPTPTSKKESTTAKDTSVCTVTIQCREILSHRSQLEDGVEEFVPSGGVILSSYKVKCEAGDTAFTVFQRACRANGIHYLARVTVYGKYIAEINHISEKCCGKNSGWLYEVNGKLPNVATSSYSLSGGETLEFRFTCG